MNGVLSCLCRCGGDGGGDGGGGIVWMDYILSRERLCASVCVLLCVCVCV